MPTYAELLTVPGNKAVLQNFWYFTIMMCSIPFIAFYSVQFIISQNIFGEFEDHMTLVFSGASAVICVNLIIIAYARLCLTEDQVEGGEKEKKKE